MAQSLRRRGFQPRHRPRKPKGRGWKPLLHSRALGAVLLACLAAVPAACAPASPDALAREGRALFLKGQPSEAVAKLQAALRGDPDSPAAHGCLAAALHSLGDVEGALDHYWAVQRGSLQRLPAGASEELTRERELIVECEALVALRANGERKKVGLRLLIPDAVLAKIARQHSEEMRDLNYFSHESPTPGLASLTDRLKRRVPNPGSYSIAENIARRWARGDYSLAPASIGKTHAEWMESPGHRANILGKGLEGLGVGIAVDDAGNYWATQFFATYATGAP